MSHVSPNANPSHVVEHFPCPELVLIRKSQSPAQQSLSVLQVLPSSTHIAALPVQVPPKPGPWDVAHAPEQQSSSTMQGASSAAHANAFSTQMPSSHVASATQGAPPVQSPSTSTSPFAGGWQVLPEQWSLAHSTSLLQDAPSGFGEATWAESPPTVRLQKTQSRQRATLKTTRTRSFAIGRMLACAAGARRPGAIDPYEAVLSRFRVLTMSIDTRAYAQRTSGHAPFRCVLDLSSPGHGSRVGRLSRPVLVLPNGIGPG